MGFGPSQAELETSLSTKFVKKDDLKEFAKLKDIKEPTIDDSLFAKKSDISNLAKIDDLSKYFVKADFQNESDNYIDKQQTAGKLDTKITSLTYVKANELNNYVKTNALTGFAKTEDLAPYVKTSDMNTELNNYVKTTTMNTELNNYAKTTALGNYVSKADFETEMGTVIEKQLADGKLDTKLKNLTYIKSGDIPARFNTLIESQTADGPLDKKIIGFKYIKQDILPDLVKKELASATFDREETLQSFVNAFNLNGQLRSRLADAVGQSEAAQKNLLTGLEASRTFQASVAQQLSTTGSTLITNVTNRLIGNPIFPETVVSGIEGNDVIRSKISNDLVDNSNFQEAIVRVMGNEQNVQRFKGLPGSLGDDATIKIALKPKTMWCADGDICDIPADKKGFQLRETQFISGLKVPVNQSVDFGFGLGREPGATDVKKMGTNDAMMKAAFDTSTATALQNAQNTSLDIYGIGRYYVEGNVGKRHPRQIKLYDNVHVDNALNVKGASTFNENVTIANGKTFTAGGAMNVTGAATFTGLSQFNGGIRTAGEVTTGNLRVTGPSHFLENINILAGKVLQVGGTTSTGSLVVTGAASTGSLDVNGEIRANGTQIMPIGTIIPHAGIQLLNTFLNGWLRCDGSEYDINSYPDLARMLGNTYGTPSVNTKFRVPDLRGRTVIGAGTGTGGLTSRIIGQTGGAETHTLTVAQMPSHTHTGTTESAGEHTHSNNSSGDVGRYGLIARSTGDGNNTGSNMDRTWGEPKIDQAPIALTIDKAGSHTHTVTINNTGESGAHNNMQPFIVLNYIIRAK